MAEPFIGEIKIWANHFAPRFWTYCDGQTLQIAQFTALFSLLGTTYGGNGRTDFGVPHLRSRSPMHWGNAPGLTPRQWGEFGGISSVALTYDELPAHDHTVYGYRQPGTTPTPDNLKIYAKGQDPNVGNSQVYHATDANLTEMDDSIVASAGSSVEHENRQPCLSMYFCIALTGAYPSRN